jgi:hypothetical protein
MRLISYAAGAQRHHLHLAPGADLQGGEHDGRYHGSVADPLEGVDLRVFRSLFEEEDFDTLKKIRVHLTLGPIVATTEIEAALDRLVLRGYVEERKPGHWWITSQGHAVRRSLLGEVKP